MSDVRCLADVYFRAVYMLEKARLTEVYRGRSYIITSLTPHTSADNIVIFPESMHLDGCIFMSRTHAEHCFPVACLCQL